MRPRRILAYSPCLYGYGATTWLRALLMGFREQLGEVELTVVTGSEHTLPFQQAGIETLRLPTIRRIESDEGYRFSPAHLSSQTVNRVVALRQEILSAACRAIGPDVIIVQHDLIGFSGELMPLLLEKWRAREGGGPAPTFVFVSRGIIEHPDRIDAKYDYVYQQSQSIDIGELYDHLYFLEHPTVISAGRYFRDSRLAARFRYLGRVCALRPDELMSPAEVYARYLLPPEKKLVLVTLGREPTSSALSQRVVECFQSPSLRDAYFVWVILDGDDGFPVEGEALREGRLRLSRYVPDLAHLISAAELVISRCGYSTVAELMQTNRKAVVIPNQRRSGEQQYRARSLSGEPNLCVLEEEACLDGDTLERAVVERLRATAVDNGVAYSRGEAARTILADLEGHSPP